MSRRGAGSRKPRFDFVPAEKNPARRVVGVVNELLQSGIEPADACSLVTHAAAILGQGRGGLSRKEWLALCRELWDAGPHAVELAIEVQTNAPGGEA